MPAAARQTLDDMLAGRSRAWTHSWVCAIDAHPGVAVVRAKRSEDGRPFRGLGGNPPPFLDVSGVWFGFTPTTPGLGEDDRERELLNECARLVWMAGGRRDLMIAVARLCASLRSGEGSTIELGLADPFDLSDLMHTAAKATPQQQLSYRRLRHLAARDPQLWSEPAFWGPLDQWAIGVAAPLDDATRGFVSDFDPEQPARQLGAWLAYLEAGGIQAVLAINLRPDTPRSLALGFSGTQAKIQIPGWRGAHSEAAAALRMVAAEASKHTTPPTFQVDGAPRLVADLVNGRPFDSNGVAWASAYIRVFGDLEDFEIRTLADFDRVTLEERPTGTATWVGGLVRTLDHHGVACLTRDSRMLQLYLELATHDRDLWDSEPSRALRKQFEAVWRATSLAAAASPEPLVTRLILGVVAASARPTGELAEWAASTDAIGGSLSPSALLWAALELEPPDLWQSVVAAFADREALTSLMDLLLPGELLRAVPGLTVPATSRLGALEARLPPVPFHVEAGGRHWEALAFTARGDARAPVTEFLARRPKPGAGETSASRQDLVLYDLAQAAAAKGSLAEAARSGFQTLLAGAAADARTTLATLQWFFDRVARLAPELTPAGSAARALRLGLLGEADIAALRNGVGGVLQCRVAGPGSLLAAFELYDAEVAPVVRTIVPPSGRQGTGVTLEGSFPSSIPVTVHFSSTRGVVDAVVRKRTPGTLTVDAPMGVATGPISVRSKAGGSWWKPGFRVVPPAGGGPPGDPSAGMDHDPPPMTGLPKLVFTHSLSSLFDWSGVQELVRAALGSPRLAEFLKELRPGKQGREVGSGNGLRQACLLADLVTDRLEERAVDFCALDEIMAVIDELFLLQDGRKDLGSRVATERLLALVDFCSSSMFENIVKRWQETPDPKRRWLFQHAVPPRYDHVNEVQKERERARRVFHGLGVYSQERSPPSRASDDPLGPTLVGGWGDPSRIRRSPPDR